MDKKSEPNLMENTANNPIPEISFFFFLFVFNFFIRFSLSFLQVSMQHLGSRKQNSNLEADGNSGRARGGGCRRLRQRHIVIIIFEEGPNDHELPVLLRHGHGRAFLDLQLLPVRVDLLQLQPGAEAFDEVVRLGVYVGARAVRRCR